MTVTSVVKNPDELTLTVTSEFGATVERVWQLWEDPRLLERWWGPPTYPATFVDHDMSPGGTMRYYMTSPEGEKYHGWWKVASVTPPHEFRFEDGFGEDASAPADMPVTTTRVTIEEMSDAGTRMTIMSTFPSAEAMEQLVEMGMVEGLSEALGQIDALL